MSLPQYAAQAVVDIRQLAARISKEDYRAPFLCLADMIESAVHVVLPLNGAIYREGTLPVGEKFPMPNDDEIASFVGLPAPVTCFEFDWVAGPSVHPRKMVAVVTDGKQFEDNPHTHVTVMAVIKGPDTNGQKFIPIIDYMRLAAPLQVMPDGGFLAAAESFVPAQYNPTPEVCCEVQTALNAAIQCCHALRAGAFFKEETPNALNSLRCAALARQGVRGFTYHVLKLPRHVEGARHIGGQHSSPRLHVRRAHIRKLPSGALTFVRRCFVGNHELGVVGKHYAVSGVC